MRKENNLVGSNELCTFPTALMDKENYLHLLGLLLRSAFLKTISLWIRLSTSLYSFPVNNIHSQFNITESIF